MGTLYLVRHGQASFGSDDYDRLSDLGARQCERLGEYFRTRGIVFDGAITGTLQRQVESFEALARGLQAAPGALAMPGLNEYDSAAIVRTVHPQPLPPARNADEVRQHFRLLRQGLLAWMDGTTRPEGMPSFAAFRDGIVAALDHVRANYEGHVLVVSSGGPIATAVAHVLDAPPATIVELNMRMRNSALSELTFTPRRHALVTFNTLPHLVGADPGWVTHT